MDPEAALPGERIQDDLMEHLAASDETQRNRNRCADCDKNEENNTLTWSHNFDCALLYLQKNRNRMAFCEDMAWAMVKTRTTHPIVGRLLLNHPFNAG